MNNKTNQKEKLETESIKIKNGEWIYPLKINIILRKEHLVEFENFSTLGQLNDFVKIYFQVFFSKGLETKEMLFSLLLRVAVIQKNIQSVISILSQDFQHKINILTFLDKYNFSIIYEILSVNFSELHYIFADYVKKISSIVTKVDLLDKDLNNIAFRLSQRVGTFSVQTVLDLFIKPLYTEKSINNLLENLERNYSITFENKTFISMNC